MSSISFFVLTTFVWLAMVGASAGIWLENRRNPSRPLWQNPGLRDALLPVGGWCSLFVLDFSVSLIGEHHLPVALKHLLGTLALLLLYYAVLSTLYLIYRSAMRILRGFRATNKPVSTRPIPLLDRLAFPIMFVSAALAAVSVLHYDGLSQNLIFIACIVVAIAIVPRSAKQSGRSLG